jgi:SNF2 family DNA or RNA helicase
MRTRSELKSWQSQAIEILVANNYQLLGAQPGSGKTITTLTALTRKKVRTLLVAPSIILDTVWSQEALAWDHTQHITFDMSHRLGALARARVWFEGTSNVVTSTPDTLIKLFAEINLRKIIPFDRIVVDESQLFKNASATRTFALHALSEHVPTWLLSGTPTPNGVIDCWSPGRIVSKQGRFWQ